MNAESQAIDILLLGSGGREHAIAKKLAASPRCGKLYIAPGNGGTSQEGENISLDENDPTAVAAFAKDHGCGMVVMVPRLRLLWAWPMPCATRAFRALARAPRVRRWRVPSFFPSS